ncbi:unnamed protein product [Discula destructiva]
MPAPSFSYAQAAKGRTPAPASSPGPTADAHIKDDASSVTTAPDASANTFSTTSEVSESVKSSQIEADVGSKKLGENGEVESGPAPARDDATTAQDTTVKADSQSAAESSARPSNRSTEPADSRKGRKGKKGRSSDKESENETAATELEKEKERAKKDIANLVEGAPPKVNFWHQRAEAQAKQPSLTSIIAAAESKTKPSLEVSAKAPNGVETPEIQRGPSKVSEAPRTTADSSVRKTRGNRVTERGEQNSAPSSAVEDVTSWPTPDTVAADDGKRKTAVEPDSKEKQDDGAKASRSKPHWKKVEITPSVVFNTPLPSRNTTKPRGGGQAGRASGRGHSTSLSLPNERAPGATNDAPASREEGIEPQGRPREDVRTAFAPSEKNKKFNADHPSQRKQSVAAGARGSGPGEHPPKNETIKSSGVHESTTKKDGFNGPNPKPKRGGAHANGRGAHNGQQSFMSNGNGAPRGSNHSPPSYGPTYAPPYGGRGRGPRPGPGSNGFKGPANGLGKMHPQHPQPAGPEFNQYPVFGQAPFQPAPSMPSYPTLRLDVLRQQAEFYFSDENLYKDEFLKKKMDAQGFVSFEVIAGFNRMRIASQGDVNFIRAALLEAPSVEYVLGDGKELLRRRGDWQKFVIDGLSSNPGPTHIVAVPNPKYASPQNTYYQPMAYAQYDPTSPPYAPAYPARDMHPGYMNRHQFPGNGTQVNGHVAMDSSPLNVSAPAFSPIHPGPNGLIGAYSPVDWEEQTMKDAETMPDSELAGVQMVLKAQNSSSSESGKMPNGTAETNGIHKNGESVKTSEQGATNAGITTSPAYIAVSGAIAHVSDDNDTEPYVDVHERATAQRQAATGELPKDMQLLYKFWAVFLLTNFNLAAYREFRQCALEDAAAPMFSKYGYTSLVKFYGEVLSKSQGGGLWPGNHPMYSILGSHYSALPNFADDSQPAATASVEQV